MNNTLKYFFLLIALVFIGSCTTKEKETTTYFGGKIINPKSDFVLLFKQDKFIDSLFLDKNDKFIGEYKDFKEGLFTFKHGPEHQYVYIEPQDSILIRLNTWDFDETLVFSGTGADKNNILIDWFLESEKENKNHSIYKYYSLEPILFKFKMDSLLNLRNKKITLFKSKNNDLPSNYLNVLEVMVNYPIYKRFEQYPLRHKHLNKKSDFPITPKDFYKYRENISLNNDSLIYLGTYSSYVVSRLYNNVYSKGIPRNNKEFTVNLLNVIDKNISQEKIKNIFLYEMLVNDFLEKSTCSLDKETFYTYFKLSSDIEDKKQVQRVINDVKSLHGGKMLPKFNVLNYNNAKLPISKVVKNKNCVLYFWNPKYNSSEYIASRVKYLTKKFPKLSFIGIRINSYKKNKPIKGIDIKNQYYIDSKSKANSFLSSKLPRTLLVNNKGKILNGFASINSSKIYKQLKYLQKQ